MPKKAKKKPAKRQQSPKQQGTSLVLRTAENRMEARLIVDLCYKAILNGVSQRDFYANQHKIAHIIQPRSYWQIRRYWTLALKQVKRAHSAKRDKMFAVIVARLERAYQKADERDLPGEMRRTMEALARLYNLGVSDDAEKETTAEGATATRIYQQISRLNQEIREILEAGSASETEGNAAESSSPDVGR